MPWTRYPPGFDYEADQAAERAAIEAVERQEEARLKAEQEDQHEAA